MGCLRMEKIFVMPAFIKETRPNWWVFNFEEVDDSTPLWIILSQLILLKHLNTQSIRWHLWEIFIWNWQKDWRALCTFTTLWNGISCLRLSFFRPTGKGDAKILSRFNSGAQILTRAGEIECEMNDAMKIILTRIKEFVRSGVFG